VGFWKRIPAAGIGIDENMNVNILEHIIYIYISYSINISFLSSINPGTRSGRTVLPDNVPEKLLFILFKHTHK
jgi:hypothetical protein